MVGLCVRAKSGVNSMAARCVRIGAGATRKVRCHMMSKKRFTSKKPFNKLRVGEEFSISKNGPMLMKLGGGLFRGVYLAGHRKGQTWAPPYYYAEQEVFIK